MQYTDEFVKGIVICVVKFFTKYIFWITIGLAFCAVLFTALQSGYFYQIDNDELYHSQLAYLIDHGYTIYSNFYTTYTPVFYWLLQPVFRFVGYDVQALSAGRIVMMGLFLLRLGVVFLIIRSLFSWKASLLSVFLFIMDPFAVMTVMQIRPDNLMLFLFSCGLYSYILARKSQKKLYFFIAGACISLSLISLMKIIPSVGMFLMIAVLSAWQRKTLKDEGVLLLGFFMTSACIFGLFMIQGSLNGVIQQTIFDPFVVFNALLYPVPYGFYHREGNMWFYGPWNRSIAWIYAQVMMPLAGFGLASAIQQIQAKVNPLVRDILIILSGALVFQWLWLLTVPSIFIQYYLPINWIIVVLAGIAGYQILELTKHKYVQLFVYSSTGLLLLLFSYGTVKTNIFRAGIRSDGTYQKLESLWKATPENSQVFPSVLFRPIAFPLPYRVHFTEFPEAVMRRFPPLKETLIKQNIQYIYNEGGVIDSLPLDAHDYIRENFVPGGIDSEIFVRKDLL